MVPILDIERPETWHLLEYVKIAESSVNGYMRPIFTTAESDAPEGLTAAESVFLQRYDTIVNKCPLKYEEFIKDEPDRISSAVHFFGLDIDKFWIAVLFAYDFCDSTFGYGTGIKQSLSTWQQVYGFVEAIGNVDYSLSSANGYAQMHDDILLSLKVNDKEIAVLDNPMAIFQIGAYCLEKLYKGWSKTPWIQPRWVHEKGPTYNALQIQCFASMITAIVQDREDSKEKHRPLKLISLLVYYLGINNNSALLNKPSGDTIKGYLNKAKKVKAPQIMSSVYYCLISLP